MGQKINEILSKEHDGTNEIKGKKAMLYGWDYTNLVPRRLAVDANGAVDVSGSAALNLQQVLDNGNTYTTSAIHTGADYLAGMELSFLPASSSNLLSRLVETNTNNAIGAGDIGLIRKVDTSGVSITGDTITFDTPIVDLIATFGTQHSVISQYFIYIELVGSTSDDGLYIVQTITGASNNIATVTDINGGTPSFPAESCTANASWVSWSLFASDSFPAITSNVSSFNTSISGTLCIGHGNVVPFGTAAEDAYAIFITNDSPTDGIIGGFNSDPTGPIIGGTGATLPTTTGWGFIANLTNLTTGAGMYLGMPYSNERWIHIVDDIKAGSPTTYFLLDPSGIFHDSNAVSGNILQLDSGGTTQLQVNFQGDTQIRNHAAIGPSATTAATTIVRVADNISGSGTELIGVDSFMSFNGATMANEIIGIYGVGQSNASVSATDAIGVKAQSRSVSNTLTNGYGMYIEDAFVQGGASLTNNYGLYMEDMNAGGTSNWGVYVVGGLSFFGDGVQLGQIASPPSTTDGTIYYDSTNGFQFREAGVWLDLSGGLTIWQRTGTDITPLNSGDTLTMDNDIRLDDNTGTSPMLKCINGSNNEFQLYIDSADETFMGSYGDFQIVPGWQNLLTPPKLFITAGSQVLNLTVEDAVTRFTIKGDDTQDPGGLIELVGGDALSAGDGGSVRIYGGDESGGNTDGDVLLAYDGSAAKGRVAVGVNTFTGTEILRVNGATELEDGVNITLPLASTDQGIVINNNTSTNTDSMQFFDSGTQVGFINASGVVWSGTFTNNIVLDYGAGMTMAGTGRRRGIVSKPADQLTPNAATYNTIICGAAGTSISVNTWNTVDFDQTSPEAAILHFQIPAEYDAGTDISVEIHWASLATAGDCRWQLGVLAVGGNESYVGAISFQTPINTTAQGTAGDRNSTKFTVTGTGFEPEDDVALIIFRDAGNLADTMASDANLLSVSLGYLKGQWGNGATV